MFSRGAPAGPSVLLRKLKGEHIDWEEVMLNCQETYGTADTYTDIIKQRPMFRTVMRIKKKWMLEK